MELLASREKLMAGLPTYATYFGTDNVLAIPGLLADATWHLDEPINFPARPEILAVVGPQR